MRVLKYSRQREAIKQCLMSRNDHPTADTLYNSLRDEFPNISLGTVYRNLNLLVELGEIAKLTCPDGVDHFDGTITPHYHLECRRCGNVEDLPMEYLGDLDQKAEKQCKCKIESHSIYFHGICHNCLQHGTH